MTYFKNNSILQQTTGVDDPTKQIMAVLGDNNYTVASAISTFPTYFSSTNITTTPNFIDEGNAEFHLKSTSGLIGQGVSVTDTAWGTIGQTDLGAYKYYPIGSMITIGGGTQTLTIGVGSQTLSW